MQLFHSQGQESWRVLHNVCIVYICRITSRRAERNKVSLHSLQFFKPVSPLTILRVIGVVTAVLCCICKHNQQWRQRVLSHFLKCLLPHKTSPKLIFKAELVSCQTSQQKVDTLVSGHKSLQGDNYIRCDDVCSRVQPFWFFQDGNVKVPSLGVSLYSL